MKNPIILNNNKATKYNRKSSRGFTIPLDIYGDEMQKDRDKEAFLKLQQLQRKCEQLREKIHSFAQPFKNKKTGRSLPDF